MPTNRHAGVRHYSNRSARFRGDDQKTYIVVARFNRFNLSINERVKFGQIVGNLCGNFEEH